MRKNTIPGKKRTKRPNCKGATTFPCGLTCKPQHYIQKSTGQQKETQCRNTLKGQASNYMDWAKQTAKAKGEGISESTTEIGKTAFKQGEKTKEGIAKLDARSEKIKAQQQKQPKKTGNDTKSPDQPKSGGSIPDITMERAKREYSSMRDKYLKDNGTYKDGKLVGTTLNTDEWRGLFPEYVGTNAADVHSASSYLNKQLFAESLETMKGKGNKTMMVLSGGGGSGKGTATRKHFDMKAYPIVLDQVSDEFEGLQTKLQRAKDAGFKLQYVFVDRDPVDAWNGVVGRAVRGREKGGLARTVPLPIALKANIEARKTAIRMLKERLDIPVKIVDNNMGEGEARLIRRRDHALKFLEKQNHDYEKLYKELENETRRLHESGKIPDDIARGLVPSGSDVHRRGELRRTRTGRGGGSEVKSPPSQNPGGVKQENRRPSRTQSGSGESQRGVGLRGLNPPEGYAPMNARSVKPGRDVFFLQRPNSKTATGGKLTSVDYDKGLARVEYQNPKTGKTAIATRPLNEFLKSSKTTRKPRKSQA